MQRRGCDPKRLKARAFAYANDTGPEPGDLVLLRAVDRFGVQAVFGRPTLGAGEIRRMLRAEAIVKVCEMQTTSENWAAWRAAHPGLVAIYDDARWCARDEGLIRGE